MVLCICAFGSTGNRVLWNKSSVKLCPEIIFNLLLQYFTALRPVTKRAKRIGQPVPVNH